MTTSTALLLLAPTATTAQTTFDIISGPPPPSMAVALEDETVVPTTIDNHPQNETKEIVATTIYNNNNATHHDSILNSSAVEATILETPEEIGSSVESSTETTTTDTADLEYDNNNNNNKTSAYKPTGATTDNSYFDDNDSSSYHNKDDAYQKDDKKDSIDQYYGALSVAILTLGLILCVEEFRHRIDHSAVGRPFFQAVLDGVYRELATLGVVELAVHLIQTYGTLDKERKAVFADVHFLLFYTAIFNAFQAAILAFCSSRVSTGLWVQTEELELDHYVEIREEFDRIHEELYGAPVPKRGLEKQKKSFSKSFRTFAAAFNTQGETEGVGAKVKRFFLAAVYTVIFPRKKAKYNRLLVQVRFHELRVHFLESYDLPLKMKVSDYLVKSQQHVLEHFVHVSHSTWLILTAFCNILYFLCGIASDVSGVAETSGYSLSIIYFSVMVIFVALSVAVYFHMESIFKKLMYVCIQYACVVSSIILRNNQSQYLTVTSLYAFLILLQYYRKAKDLWNIHDDDENDKDSTRRGELAARQEEMFVLGDPHLILQSIKFMQFGYAIALSVVFVYWDDMQADDDFAASAYIMSTLFCYTVFVAVMARVLPLYTVCTSMGQLVDKERLHEVRASYRLEEAERRRHEDCSVRRHQNNMAMNKGHESTTSLSTFDVFAKDSTAVISDHDSTSAAMPMMVSAPIGGSPGVKDKRSMLADLVKMDTVSLRQVVPSERRDNRRSFSEGVSTMRQLGMSMASLGNISGSNRVEESEPSNSSSGNRKVTFDDSVVPSKQTNDGHARRQRRKSQSASADIQAMRTFKEAKLDAKDPLRGPVMDLAPTPEQSTTTRNLPSKTTADDAVHPLNTSAVETASPMSVRTSESNTVRAVVLSVVPERAELPPSAETTKKKQQVSDDDTSLSNLSDVENTSGWELEGSSDGSHEEEHPPLSISDKLALFFEGQAYTFCTHILGTMIAFFLIGMRVEGFLKEQCIIPQDDHSWDLKLQDSFRLLVAWISMFLCMSVFKIIISREHKQNSFVLAAVMDFCLCSLCLLFLLLAEHQRCCSNSEESDVDTALLEEELYDYRMLQGSDECIDGTFGCACAEFGERTYGGLGNLEPWVALVGLRVFRFFVAKRIVKKLKIGYRKVNIVHDHGHSHGGVEDKGTAKELWTTAVLQHPDLVEKHGEFSAEVLQAMLGIEIIETERATPAHTRDNERKVEQIEGSDVPFVAPPTRSTEERSHVFLTNEKYSKLTPGAQEIIAAGKLGLPAKPCLPQDLRLDGYAPAAAMAPLEFEIDEKTAQAELDNRDVSLSYPNARLVRSMRRCERKLMPLLNKWTVVDVAITNHEMVYVEVCDSHDTSLGAEDLRRREASRSAVVATGGGKGLRLCDVTAGRRVVGHIGLSDIHSVHVEREVPSSEDSTPSSGVPPEEQNEYWQPVKGVTTSADTRQKRWEAVNQDRLKLVTLHGTLFLRFHSDLFDSETHPERILMQVGDESPLHKDIAFQWAQTIVRHCGVSQLRQDLPHFGHNDGDELRDYLQIVKHNEHKHRRFGRTSSRGTPGRQFSFKRKNSKAKKTNAVVIQDSDFVDAEEDAGNLVVNV